MKGISLLVIIANEATIDEVGASSDISTIAGREECYDTGDLAGSPRRPSGMFASSASSFGLSANSDLLIGVLMAPGAILFTVIPAGPSSTARSRISIRIAPLLAQ